MKPTLTIGNATIYAGNNLEVLPTLPDNSVDSIVCDPPYELGFMGKSWDSSGIAYSVKLWQECLRVLKPGGHLLAFGGTRTWHRLAVAIEDAGFEIRDNIAWLYGSGFPKSHNISKAIDKFHGAERKVIGQTMASPKGISQAEGRTDTAAGAYGGEAKLIDITAPATNDAKKWDGWGTALKPAHEPIVVARKPVIGTVAQNVLTYGVGGLNIDATRVEGSSTKRVNTAQSSYMSGQIGEVQEQQNAYETGSDLGRWPANIILDEYTAELLDEQSGISKSQGGTNPIKKSQFNLGSETRKLAGGFGDTGGASRFFYVAKANKRDRNEGLENIEGKEISAKGNGLARTCNTCGASTLDGCDCPDRTFSNPIRQNFHPTVKPTALMQYLIRLVTPDNGVVLDPFAGSGSTGKAAILERKHFIGIEITPEYLPIIEGRLTHAYETVNSKEDLF
jgi:site-specific DNA-methyltransferase (adenine-specific)